ncbi:MAG: molybdopterin-guanine dinucleotide biosynthesis protein B [Sedimentisphaerales bacterium]|nr:molybdopterin-guanine dinucleotide biosynthesis protein B [Sedimentisphaerales bacterium]
MKIPVIGISGFKNSGKTTLIEGLLDFFVGKGMRVAVVKHSHEPIESDREGSDTDRFFRSGASVLAYNEELVFTKKRLEEPLTIDDAIAQLGGKYDLILVEGLKRSDIDKIWLLREGEVQIDETISNVIAVLPWGENRRTKALAAIKKLFLEKYQREL